MPITANLSFKNTLLDSIDSVFNSATLEIRTGSAPGAGLTATGTLLASITVPSDAFSAAVNGVKQSIGTWADASADASGTAGHWRLIASSGQILEGDITVSGAGGSMQLDSLSITVGSPINILSFKLIAIP